jgi:hypothetical protein
MEADMQEQCSSCSHFRGSFEKSRPSCRAFPLGIPEEIWEGVFDHNNPFEGDRGIRFEPVFEGE